MRNDYYEDELEALQNKYEELDWEYDQYVINRSLYEEYIIDMLYGAVNSNLSRDEFVKKLNEEEAKTHYERKAARESKSKEIFDSFVGMNTLVGLDEITKCLHQGN